MAKAMGNQRLAAQVTDEGQSNHGQPAAGAGGNNCLIRKQRDNEKGNARDYA